MILSSPAKINLSLDILKKRSDGYHDIESNFQFIDWGDKLKIKPSKKLKVQVNNFSISEKENLVTKAIRKLELISDCALNFSINIDKNIPLGSGLGGGSSNAASALLAINSIAKLNFSLESLLKIGLEIGSDVPFFLNCHAAKVSGKGEKIESKIFKEEKILVLLPECEISSKDAYDAITLKVIKNNKHYKNKNFFEEWVLDNFIPVKEAFNFLENFKNPKISGTGSSLYVVIKSFEEGKEIMDNAPYKIRYVITNTINKSPLLNELLNSGV